MRFFAYVLLTLCIAISLWFFQMPTPITYVLGVTHSGQAYDPTGAAVYGGKPMEMTNFLQNIGKLFSTTDGIARLIGFVAATVALTSLTGFSSMYFVPVILLLFIVNFVAMPISQDILAPSCINNIDPALCMTQSNGLPAFIFYPLLILFNVLTVMACISFIRGGV